MVLVDLVIDSDDPGADCRSLVGWLAEGTSLSGVEVRLVTASGQGGLGPGGEAARLWLEPGGSVVALASAVGGWLVSRSGPIRLRMLRGDDEIEIEASRVRDVERIEERIRRGLGAE